MRRRFLVNPAAARHTDRRSALATLEAELKRRGLAFDAVFSRDRDHLIELAREAVEDGVEQLIAVGGDGTVNAVANGFFDHNGAALGSAMLGILPWGTGCDYYKAIGGDRNKPLAALLEGKPRLVDIGRIESLSSGTFHHFLNAASTGLSAEVVRRQRQVARWLPPLLSYSYPALTTLLSFRPVPLRFTLDGKKIDGSFLGAFFAKGLYLGGGMRFGGNVTLEDGRLDVTLLHAMNVAQSLPRFAKIFSGRFHGDSKITKTLATEIRLQSPSPLPMEFDGELCGTTDVLITVLPRALAVCGPAQGS